MVRLVGPLVWLVERLRAVYRFISCAYYRTKLAACGDDVWFDPSSSDIAYPHVRLGSRVYIGPGAIIGRADIGCDVMLAPNVAIRDGYHHYEQIGKPIRDSGGAEPGRVVIGDDVWIGEGAVVLRQGAVGEGAVVGTRSVVTEPIPPYTVAVGTPARVVKARFSDDDLREHLRLRGVAHARIEALVTERAAALAAAGRPGR
jgi:acetyltransferase-like isoleucine patch superfamily enzyme